MRIFLSPRMREMFRSLAGDSGEAISHRSLDKSIERAQRKVEGHNFDVRARTCSSLTMSPMISGRLFTPSATNSWNQKAFPKPLNS